MKTFCLQLSKIPFQFSRQLFFLWKYCLSILPSFPCKTSLNFYKGFLFATDLRFALYQLLHLLQSVLRRKIVRQNDNGTIRFRNWSYSGSSSTSLEDDEEYQEIFGEGPIYFEQRREGSPPSDESSPTTEIGSNKTSSDGGASGRSASASNICLESGQHSQNQSLFGSSPILGHSISDTVVFLGHHQHQRWNRSEALQALIGGGIHSRMGIGLRHHLHRK